MTSHSAKFLIGLLFSAAALAESKTAPSPIPWEPWSDKAFERASAEKRLVILDLVAVWCHWCHVMEETTYRDPEVVRQLREHFVALRVDQDSRPDLSNRYEDYGWPATVIFDADGRELVKFAGYIPPSRMRTLLEGVVADPTPGPSITETEGGRREAGGEAGTALSPERCSRSSRHCWFSATTRSLGAGASPRSTWTGTASSTVSLAPAPLGVTPVPSAWRSRRSRPRAS